MVELQRILRTPEHYVRGSECHEKIEALQDRWPSIALSVRNETKYWLSENMGKTISTLLASDKKHRVEHGLSLFRASHWYEVQSANTTIVSVEMIGSNQKRMEHLLNEAIKIANSFDGKCVKPEIEVCNGDPSCPYSARFKIGFTDCC